MKKYKNLEDYTAEQLRTISDCAPCFGADYNFKCNKCGNIVDSETIKCDRCGSYDIIHVQETKKSTRKITRKFVDKNFCKVN